MTDRVTISCGGTDYLNLTDDEVASFKISYTPSIEFDDIPGFEDPGANITTQVSTIITLTGRLTGAIATRITNFEDCINSQGGTDKGEALQVTIFFGEEYDTSVTYDCVCTSADIDFGNGRINDLPYTIKLTKVDSSMTYAI